MAKGPKVILGMSGGVDSSVAAALLVARVRCAGSHSSGLGGGR